MELICAIIYIISVLGMLFQVIQIYKESEYLNLKWLLTASFFTVCPIANTLICLYIIWQPIDDFLEYTYVKKGNKHAKKD